MSQFRRKLLESYATNKLVYPGLIAAWSAKGKTNEDGDRNILKDLTGNGHDITLNNFAYSEMSGYGGYSFSFKQFNSNYHSTKIIKEITEDTGASRWLMVNKNLGFTAPEFRIKYKVVGNSGLSYTYTDKNGSRRDLSIVKSNSGGGSGEITIPQCYSSVVELNGFTYYAYPGSITIELLPEYPDALVFDGVDDYGANGDMPIISDYTLIVEREILSDFTVRGMVACYTGNPNGDTGPFWFEYGLSPTTINTFSFGKKTEITDILNKNRFVSYQTKSKYNGKDILFNDSLISGNIIRFGGFYAYHGIDINMAFYSAYLFDRSLDEQEIKSFIRKHIDPEYLLPSEIPTPDCYYDFSQGSNDDENRDTIKDLSGNGNDAVAHNFAWNEESGYAEGRLKFDGVDDYISLDAFDSVFKTMFMVCTNFEAPAGSILYDQRSELFNKNYSVAYYPSSIAYNNDNINGTYINGTLNTKLACQELNNKKHLIHVVAKDISESRKPNIGRSLGQNQYSNMMLYKFLGFKEALTEEQIKAVINKYNLLDGVDTIN